VNLLLDTNALLWFALGDSRLSATARESIEDANNSKQVSPAAYRELAIKIAIGKYVLHEPYASFVDRAVFQNGFLVLPVEPRYTAALIDLPFHHRDPFDRLMVAQAMIESLTIVSADPGLDAYPIQRLW
jgi:PIN domain nuclease of toxin-antitoxin system